MSLKLLAGVLAFVGFLIGLAQYRQAQNWKGAEIVLGLIDSFKNDPKIKAACLMLDWDRREIQIDDKNSFLFRNEMLISGLCIIWMDADKTIPLDALSESIDQERAGHDGFNRQEVFIRDCFDAFFDYFDKINAFRRSALVEWKDLGYFSYWLKLVQKIGDNKNNPKIQQTVDLYLRIYEFKGFLELSEEYRNQTSPSSENNLRAFK